MTGYYLIIRTKLLIIGSRSRLSSLVILFLPELHILLQKFGTGSTHFGIRMRFLLSDHLRAIRFQLFKITQYKLSLQNLTRLADWKNGVWDQAKKLEQVRSAMETRLLSWVLELTYPNDWLAFLACSYPIDHENCL